MNRYEEYKNDLLNTSLKIKRDLFKTYYEKFKYNNLLILGIRQIGKTTLAKQITKMYINEKKISKSDFIIFDFRVKSIRESFRNILNINKKIKVVMIDEVQLLDNWNDEIQSLIDLNKNIKFILTGSNSLQLRMNNMVGRAAQFLLKPLSWKEYKKFWNNDFDTFINYGSFPKRLNTTSPVVQNIELSEQVLKDVIREDLKNKLNIDKFTLFASNILNYIGSEVKITKLPSDVGIENRTGKEYLDVLINSGVIRTISNSSEKSLNSKLKKIYFSDSTLINVFNKHEEHNSSISGKLAENKVFNYLDSKYNIYFDDFNVSYFKENKEIDFLIEKEKLAIEVKYSSNLSYINEGIKNLIKYAPENFTKIIITKNVNQLDIETGIKLVSLEEFFKND